MDLDTAMLLVVCLAVLVGSFVQSSIGLGAGLVAAPVVTIADPRLMPTSLIVVGMTISLLMIWKHWRDVDVSGLSWALIGRLPGTVLGAAIVAWLPTRQIGLAVGCAILAAVILTWRSITVAKTRPTLLLAGAVSGVTGTAAGIGGPPVGLIYAEAPGPVVRSTLAVYFLVGGFLSLVALAGAGELESRSVLVGALAVPFVVVGNLAARRAVPWLDAGRLRGAILAVSAVSAVALISRSLA